jgi:hypothetical protein
VPIQRVAVDTNLANHQTLVARTWGGYQIVVPKSQFDALSQLADRVSVHEGLDVFNLSSQSAPRQIHPDE